MDWARAMTRLVPGPVSPSQDQLQPGLGTVGGRGLDGREGGGGALQMICLLMFLGYNFRENTR